VTFTPGRRVWLHGPASARERERIVAWQAGTVLALSRPEYVPGRRKPYACSFPCLFTVQDVSPRR
jgi:hypothetical protein